MNNVHKVSLRQIKSELLMYVHTQLKNQSKISNPTEFAELLKAVAEFLRI